MTTAASSPVPASPFARPVELTVRQGLVCSVLLVVTMLSAVLTLIAPVAPLPVVLWLLTLFTLPGLAALPNRAGLRQGRWWGSVIAVSLAVQTFGYVAMLWTTAWHPRAFSFLVLVASANVLAVRVLVPWWRSARWNSDLQRRLCAAAIIATIGGALALALGTKRHASAPTAAEPLRHNTSSPVGETRSGGQGVLTTHGPTGWVLVTEEGIEVPLEGVVSVGRVRVGDVDKLSANELSLTDETRTLSRRHLELTVEGDGVAAVDQGSLNGALVRRQSGEEETCAPGGRVLLREGDVIEIARRRLTLARR